MIQFATVQLHIRRHIYITLYVCLGFICSCYQLHHLVEKILHMKGNFFFSLSATRTLWSHWSSWPSDPWATKEFRWPTARSCFRRKPSRRGIRRSICIFCRNSPCILRSENLPDKLSFWSTTYDKSLQKKGRLQSIIHHPKKERVVAWPYLCAEERGPGLLHRWCAWSNACLRGWRR